MIGVIADFIPAKARDRSAVACCHAAVARIASGPTWVPNSFARSTKASRSPRSPNAVSICLPCSPNAWVAAAARSVGSSILDSASMEARRTSSAVVSSPRMMAVAIPIFSKPIIASPVPRRVSSIRLASSGGISCSRVLPEASAASCRPLTVSTARPVAPARVFSLSTCDVTSWIVASANAPAPASTPKAIEAAPMAAEAAPTAPSI